jgi:hypothetical protein
MGSSATTNQQNSNASNTASNQNSASNYGTNTNTMSGQNTASLSGQNTANVSGQNTVANTAYANGPSAAGQALIGAATSPQNTIANTQAYMNPYTQNVLGSQQAIQQQQLGQALSGVAGNAISQGALGGSRMGVAQALTAGQLQQANNAANSATLQQGYNQALQAAQNTGAQQLQGAGLSGTQGSTSADTNTLGQQLSSMLGQQLSSSLGQQQSSTAGQTQSTASGTQAQAGVSDGSGTTTQNPGALGYLGLGLGLLRGGAQANGGAVKGYDNGGAVTDSVPVTTADGRTVYVPSSAISGSQQGGLSSLGGKSTQDAMHLYKLGSQARSTLSNFLNGGQASITQQAPIAAIGQGLSSLGDAANSGLSSLGSAMGFASGGSPAAKAATVSMPSLSSFSTPAASPVAGLSSSAFYTPAVAAQATPQMPSLSSPAVAMPYLSAPSVSMPSFSMPSVAAPNVAAPTVEQAIMPYVATPNHSPVSSGGKGSGGAVRGLANGGLARLLKEFEGEGKVPGREDGGELDTGHSDPDLSGFMDFLANQQDDHNAENAPGPEPKQSDSAAAPVTLGNGFAMVPGQAVAPPAPASGGVAPLASLAPPVAAAPPAALPDAPTVVKSETYRPDGTQVPGEKVPNPFANATPIPAPAPKPLVGRQAVAGSIRDELASAGMSESGIQGIMANVKDESNFDPTSRRPDQPKWGGEAHYAHGLYQQGGAEWNNYAKWLEENHTGADWRDPKLQTQFLAQNLKENYPAVWEKMNNGTAPQAAQAFVSGYLKPREDLRLAREGQYGQGVASVADFINGAVGKIKSGVGSLVNVDAGERKDIVPASNPTDTKSQPWTMENFASNLGTSLRGSPLGKAAYGDLSGLTRMAPVVSALAGGPGGLGASRAMEAQQEQDIKRAQMQRQSQIDAMKLRMEEAKMYQPVVTGETFDPTTGAWHKRYASPSLDPETGRMKWPAAAPSVAQGRADMDTIPSDVTGSAFISEAKKIGYTPQQLDLAKQAANYDIDPNKLMTIKGPDRAIVNRLAMRINENYRPENYKAAYDTTQRLASGDVAKAVRSIGRLFDEVEVAKSALNATNNSDYESVNRAAGHIYKSGSQYQQAQGSLGTALNNVVDTASAVAKGGGQSAEGDAKRRADTMNRFQAVPTLAGALNTEAEIGLKNGQSNLTSYNVAHGYTPDNPKYKTIMDYMSPAQQKKAIAMLGADKIEEITGKPVSQEGSGKATSTNRAPIPTVSGVDEAKALIQAGKLKSGQQFIDEHGITRTVH